VKFSSLAVVVKLPVRAKEQKARSCLLSIGSVINEFLSWPSWLIGRAFEMPMQRHGTSRAYELGVVSFTAK
jgi:hypothetical protein